MLLSLKIHGQPKEGCQFARMPIKDNMGDHISESNLGDTSVSLEICPKISFNLATCSTF